MNFSVHDLLALAPGYPQNAASMPAGAFPRREFRSQMHFQEAKSMSNSDRRYSRQRRVARGNEALNDLESRPRGMGGATQEWHELVDALVEKGTNRAQAVRQVNHANPGLREQMLAEANA